MAKKFNVKHDIVKPTLSVLKEKYPDVTMTELEQKGGFKEGEIIPIVIKLCKMTKSATLRVCKRKDKAYVFKSRKRLDEVGEYFPEDVLILSFDD